MAPNLDYALSLWTGELHEDNFSLKVLQEDIDSDISLQEQIFSFLSFSSDMRQTFYDLVAQLPDFSLLQTIMEALIETTIPPLFKNILIENYKNCQNYVRLITDWYHYGYVDLKYFMKHDSTRYSFRANNFELVEMPLEQFYKNYFCSTIINSSNELIMAKNYMLTKVNGKLEALVDDFSLSADTTPLINILKEYYDHQSQYEEIASLQELFNLNDIKDALAFRYDIQYVDAQMLLFQDLFKIQLYLGIKDLKMEDINIVEKKFGGIRVFNSILPLGDFSQAFLVASDNPERTYGLTKTREEKYMPYVETIRNTDIDIPDATAFCKYLFGIPEKEGRDLMRLYNENIEFLNNALSRKL